MERAPLGTTTNIPSKLPTMSKLPVFGKLKQPSQIVKPSNVPSKTHNATVSNKRTRSPESLPNPQKRAKTESSSSISTTAKNPRSNGQCRPTTRATNRPVAKSAVAANSARNAPIKSIGTRGRKPLETTSNVTNNKSKPPATGGTKKRPAWDLKGRLEDMEKILTERNLGNNELVANLANNSDRMAGLESLKIQLESELNRTKNDYMIATQEIQDINKKFRDSKEELETTTRKFGREVEDLKFSKSTLQRHNETLDGELSASRQEASGLKSTVAQLTSAQAGITAELSATKLSLQHSLQSGIVKDGEIVEMKRIIEEQKNELIQHETERRKLHNTIQELKGNIRVFCRVRPLLPSECTDGDAVITHMHFPDDGKTVELDRLTDNLLNESTMNCRKGNNGNKFEFNFDKVFQPESSQTDVFEEISQLVQSSLDGYNVCIFAYGQTGSGKTYTMEGSPPNNEGMIPKAVSQVFQTVAELEDKGWTYEFEASFLEIYNETIRDLLGNGKEDTKHEIKLTGSTTNDVLVTNLKLVKVTAGDQVHKLLLDASENRAVAETKCNERSSRSHSVFRLRITGNNNLNGESCHGTLNLIDLAGSERLKESKAEGMRLKETQAINKSLSNLGNVIMALANKDQHIPYRNSKLTYLLQNCLGGNSKTLMFVNVSPKEDNLQETVCSLRFATKVNQCQIGTATKKVK